MMKSPKCRDKLVAFHIIGSHGPTYYLRYPAEHRHFMPECARSDIENCTQEQLVNTYDNTLRYTDYVLAEMIEKLKITAISTTPCCFMCPIMVNHWAKAGYICTARRTNWHRISRRIFRCRSGCHRALSPGNTSTCLALKIMRRKNHIPDNLFSSILGLWDVSTSVYNPDRDLFRECRG